MRKYPVGVSDYQKIVQDGYFYWDRTLFLKEFYDDVGEVEFSSLLPPFLTPTDPADSASSSLGKDYYGEYGELLLRHHRP